MKAKIRLDTTGDVTKFVDITSEIDCPVVITDNQGLRVNAKSIFGALHAMEFSELWCESEKDIYASIKDFIVE